MGDLNEMATCLIQQQVKARKRRLKVRLCQGFLAVTLGLTAGLYSGITELQRPVGQVSDTLCKTKPCITFEVTR